MEVQLDEHHCLLQIKRFKGGPISRVSRDQDSSGIWHPKWCPHTRVLTSLEIKEQWLMAVLFNKKFGTSTSETCTKSILRVGSDEHRIAFETSYLSWSAPLAHAAFLKSPYTVSYTALSCLSGRPIQNAFGQKALFQYCSSYRSITPFSATFSRYPSTSSWTATTPAWPACT